MTTAPRYLELSTASSFSTLTLMSMLMSSSLVICLVFYALIHATGSRGLVQAIHQRGQAKPSMSSAKRKLVIVLPPMLTVPL